MKRVLIVDDEEDMVWTLGNHLSTDTLPLEVYTARSAEEALEKLKNTDVDLIVTDIRMPGMNGLELITEVKKQKPTVKFIVMTAYPSVEYRRETARRGALRFIEKPFDINSLRQQIKELLFEEKGFEATVAGIELVDIIQLNCLSRVTCALRVTTPVEEGIIYFQNGNIVHAIYEDIEGEEAFYRIAAFRGGKIESIPNATPPAITIDKGHEALLMEAMRRIDEAQRTGESSTESFSENLKKEVKKMAETTQKLQDLMDIQGVLAVCLVSRDGFVVDSLSKTDIDTEMVGAITSSGLGASESMGKQLSMGALNLSMVEFENGPVLFAPVSDDAFLVVVGTKDINLGMVRMKIKKHIGELSMAFMF